MRTPPRRVTGPALAAAGVIPALLLGIRTWRRRWLTVEVAGESMTPALQPGDWLIVRRGTPPDGASTFGCIVVARESGGRLLLKRVVGLPGETVELRDGRVYVDGRALVEDYASGATQPAPYRPLTRVDRDAYYLLGDNRAASTDSRDHGTFHIGRSPAVEGVAIWRYWPPERIGRLERPARRFEGESESASGAPTSAPA